ncbi:MAG: phosphoribosylformylglycinamidine synthase I [Pirellulaceae bacterium]
MPTPHVLILRAPGTNCDRETAYAFRRAGAKTTTAHINELLANPTLASSHQVLCVPGGFSYGDDIAAGRILANQIRHHLGDMLRTFQDQGKLVLGICNGFQVLIKAGVLLPDDTQGEPATLTWNASGRFQCRWVRLCTTGSRCVFLRGIEYMYLPIAHAEGKFVARDEAILQDLNRRGQLALRYQAADRSTSGSDETLPFPCNPNGSAANVAGICDESGRVFGLMPHPERHIDATQHPRWTRGEASDPGDGLRVFQNAVAYFAG